ncbi:MAG: outer membrane protein assembly factor BamA [Gammaproteobacteria bacterium]|uniref:outer membrane protein assembly factor BamA n=1 Tax=Pseudomaricurvus alcaniphilus TaxID=1166482 RepID=UPI00140A41FB|nr:outer membrane protein assembly factor BamA [Pseudomaricurvus alcaniphilus]MBR9911008.1 outer membrane protein assembly factor BamA [Gammaproteobacteria bacterium]NHN37716.1 outer membrane protein assembly factor BamA [Pseudomaricurvus alcaniphilus]
MKRCRYLFVALLLLPVTVFAAQFRVADIRLEGLQRVSAGTVFAALPVQVGETIDTLDIQRATRSLFRTGFFADIKIGRDDDVLVIVIKERPAISEIEIEGNKAIKTEDLKKGMTDNGLAEGQIFKQATLEGLTRELERQYVSQGRYSAKVETEVIDLPRNQVKLKVTVDEGTVASIKHINVVGNSAFSDKELGELFELKTTGWLSWLNSNDRYSKEKLTGDLERLESWYLDRGYLEFKIDSTQVSLSPDKETVYITANITEGPVYTVSAVELAGEPVIPEEQIKRLFILREGQTFSQVLMTTTSDYITQRLGNEGYTFAEVRGIPELNEEDSTVKVTFFMDPGKRAYVRRIDFRGNTKSTDEVLRREMRQMEGGSASTSRIESSKVRLERLGYFKEVKVDTREVPGTSDQVDVEYTVEEQPSGSIGASFGYAQGTGFVLGANVQQNNWFGTGKAVGFNVSTSSYQTVYSFNYTDPYFTPDGVSRGFNIFYRARDFSEYNISSYTTDSFGGSVNFGYPISEVERLSFGIGISNISIETGSFAVQEIIGSPRPTAGINWVVDQADYLGNCFDSSGAAIACDLSDSGLDLRQPYDPNAAYNTASPDGWIDIHGDSFNIMTLNGSWRQSTLNRGRLATRGSSQSLSLELSLPGGDLEYYKVTYDAQYFRPLTRSLTLRLRTSLGYANAYGGTDELPFFEHFYAGGFGSVRGFKRNTLGPLSTPAVFYTSPLDVVTTAGSVNSLDDFAYIIDSTTGKLRTQTASNDDDPFGGNILVEGSAEILFPLPFIKDQRSMQSAFFIDAGNVFDANCGPEQLNCFDFDISKLSVSAGIGVTWISGFGPLTFSIAKPLVENEYDDTEFFQFSLGSSF